MNDQLGGMVYWCVVRLTRDTVLVQCTSVKNESSAERATMTEHEQDQPPAWWVVDRRAKREAEHEAKRQERAARRDARRTARHGAPAREPMTPERIADAALSIIDSGGLDGLTVRSLAQALGVGTMTLYWYVRDKDEVLDLVADRLLAGVTPPTPMGDWKAAIR
ncbi:MAG TPA: TetR family transcriptional regulator, partial [Candidatus Limnocylindrales bacterium]